MDDKLRPIHPGETLMEILHDNGWTVANLSARTGLSEEYINKIINGECSISSYFSSILEKTIGISASFWDNLQKNYDKELFEYNYSK